MFSISKVFLQCLLRQLWRILSPMYRSYGIHHNLEKLYAELNARYFHGLCSSVIQWGKATSYKRRKSIQLGCYVPQENTIRIHPCLDQDFVPSFFVGGVVFHEMLHEVYGAEERCGKRWVHPPVFRVLEEMYAFHHACKTWEKEHVHKLLSY
jgi:hypothetical protein